MNRVYLIRHGKPKSTWGQSSEPDPGLDATGIGQAEAASDALLALPEPFRPITAISSPLRRCRETAAPFARALGVEAHIDPTFGEVPTPAAVAEAHRPAWLKTAFAGRWQDIQGDLDYDAWRRDILAGLARWPGAAIFSHYVAINGVVSLLQGRDEVLAFRPDHTSITTVELTPEGPRLLDLGREAVTGVL